MNYSLIKSTGIMLSMVLLTACASAEEKACHAEFEKTLINPETATYSDFKPVSDQEIESNFAYKSYRRVLTEGPTGSESNFFTLKVRADGKLGNTITSNQFCSVSDSKDECTCIELP